MEQSKKIVIVGAGGFGREVLWLIDKAVLLVLQCTFLFPSNRLQPLLLRRQSPDFQLVFPEYYKFLNQLKEKGISFYQIDFTRSAWKISRHFRAYKQLKKLIQKEVQRFLKYWLLDKL